MWNKQYQAKRIKDGKKFALKGINWCEWLIMKIMKHLINIFLFTFIFAFIGMLYVVTDANTDDLGIESESIRIVKFVEDYLSSNANYYGLNKTPNSTVTEAL